jgi:carboxymethylenebutenolidase
MCDKDSFDDMVAYRLRRELLSRRNFGSLSLSAGLASLLPTACKSADPAPASVPASVPAAAPTPAASASASASAPPPSPANAVATNESEVTVTTPDGACDAYFVHPATGTAPAVLVWPDIFGLRPAFRQMGKRLAESGYAVLVVNPFYRTKKAPTSTPHADFDDPATRDALTGLARSLTPETEVTDAKALTAWLDQQPSVEKSRKMGTTGYCMGGPLVLRTAATNPDRIGAAATFHGGGLVTDKPDSPHLLIPKMKARFLVAIAANDDAKQPDAKGTLQAAFAKASLPAKVEVFDGTMHGWCPPDSHVYNADAAEKAWSELLELFKSALS